MGGTTGLRKIKRLIRYRVKKGIKGWIPIGAGDVGVGYGEFDDALDLLRNDKKYEVQLNCFARLKPAVYDYNSAKIYSK